MNKLYNLNVEYEMIVVLIFFLYLLLIELNNNK